MENTGLILKSLRRNRIWLNCRVTFITRTLNSVISDPVSSNSLLTGLPTIILPCLQLIHRAGKVVKTNKNTNPVISLLPCSNSFHVLLGKSSNRDIFYKALNNRAYSPLSQLHVSCARFFSGFSEAPSTGPLHLLFSLECSSV